MAPASPESRSHARGASRSITKTAANDKASHYCLGLGSVRSDPGTASFTEIQRKMARKPASGLPRDHYMGPLDACQMHSPRPFTFPSLSGPIQGSNPNTLSMPSQAMLMLVESTLMCPHVHRIHKRTYTLVGVLDWEWSCVIPAQMLVPPVWVTGGSPEWMLLNKSSFYTEVGRLVATIRNREQALQVPPRLSREWAKIQTWCHTAVVIALLSPDLTHDIYGHFLFDEIEEAMPPDSDFREFYLTAIAPRLTAFMKPPERKTLLARKEDEQRRFFEDEKEHFNNPYTRHIIEEGSIH
ncbi:hypothetical protein B0J13DRAFT_651212 [Dactylonectria estremocensis]|uniref:Uncharacterized protein n=1 Tax=Dactylonectria estremocensis TaxID=1079267 RepID=A0A9P9IHC4_9HYPO|nr:hypothetical protein B0J13DRAFT_651212 [Dactylonectria estremocensis]